MNAQLQYYQAKLDYEWDAADLFDELEIGRQVVVVDARKPAAYEEQHIPGAISLPHRTISELSTRGWSKGPVYVCYCDGIGCNASTKGALKLTQLGFKVKELIGGIEWWKRDGYATEGEKAVKGTRVKCAC